MSPLDFHCILQREATASLAWRQQNGGNPRVLPHGRIGTQREAGIGNLCFEEPTMYLSNDAALPRFASLPEMAMPQQRSWLSNFWMAPFRDVDDRVARLAAGKRAEKVVREGVISVAPSRA
jgi:hypothetical protein